MSSLDGLHVEVEDVGLLGVGADRGISAVCKRAGLPVAETADIVLVAAKVCLLLVVWGASRCCQWLWAEARRVRVRTGS